MTPRLRVLITGTDTGVGKTVVTGGLARTWLRAGKRVRVAKPFATGATWESGCWLTDDARWLSAAVEGRQAPETLSAVQYALPAAPLAAAWDSGVPWEWGQLDAFYATLMADTPELLVVEGIGGLMVPLGLGVLVSDLAIRWRLPLVIVARSGLGTLNHTLLTVDHATGRGLPVVGVILNDGPGPADARLVAGNIRLLETWGIPVLGRVTPLQTEQAAHDASGWDWDSVADVLSRTVNLPLLSDRIADACRRCTE